MADSVVNRYEDETTREWEVQGGDDIKNENEIHIKQFINILTRDLDTAIF